MCVYYNDKISVRQMSNINLTECLACESVIGKKKEYVITFYRSPIQNQSEFEHFLLSLENLLCNIRNKDPALQFYWVTVMPGLRVGGFTTSQTTKVHKLSLSVCCMIFLN